VPLGLVCVVVAWFAFPTHTHTRVGVIFPDHATIVLYQLCRPCSFRIDHTGNSMSEGAGLSNCVTLFRREHLCEH
jgi:hypothetical protein